MSISFDVPVTLCHSLDMEDTMMTRDEIRAAIDAGVEAVRAVSSLSTYAMQGTGLLTIADRVIAAGGGATEICTAIMADRQAVLAAAQKKLQRSTLGPERRRQAIRDRLAAARDADARALGPDADLAR